MQYIIGEIMISLNDTASIINIRKPTPIPAPSTKQINDASTFNVLQLNANGICNKPMELCVVIQSTSIEVAVIQESRLSSKPKKPCIRNYTTVCKDRHHGHGGELLIFIHRLITFCCCWPHRSINNGGGVRYPFLGTPADGIPYSVCIQARVVAPSHSASRLPISTGSITFFKQPSSQESLYNLHLEKLSTKAKLVMGNNC